MLRTYTIVKKGSVAHLSALASRFIKNVMIVPAGKGHVLIPSHRRIDFGHDVSHAKNRVQRMRLPNMQNLKIEIDGSHYSIQLSAKDMRTYRKALAQ
jgi:ribosomal protein L28